MKKKILLLLLVFMFVFASLVSAASVPNDVPRGHWAYPAIRELAQQGLIDGYSEGSFRGDKLMTRYEMAQLVEKAVKNQDKATPIQKGLIDKLNMEFALELNKIDVRVTNEENKTKFWVGGETRIRFIGDDPAPGTSSKMKRSDNFEFRQRIKFMGNLDDSTSIMVRIANTGLNKAGNLEHAFGSEVLMDLAYITHKNALGFDSIRLGRSFMDGITYGMIGKQSNADGIRLEKKFGATDFRVWTGNVKTNSWNGTTAFANNESRTFTSTEIGGKLADNFTVKAGHFWADIPGTSTADGNGSLNTNTGSFSKSEGTSLSFAYKFGELTLFGDYVMSKLKDSVGIPSSPKGYFFQLTNSKSLVTGAYAGVNLVNPTKVGTDAWMISYRSIDPGTVPNGVWGFETMPASNIGSYDVFRHGTDNVNALYLAYQTVLKKNVLLSLEYQDIKFKKTALTSLSSSDMNKTYQVKLDYYY